jgi:hypothetical protein
MATSGQDYHFGDGVMKIDSIDNKILQSGGGPTSTAGLQSWYATLAPTSIAVYTVPGDDVITAWTPHASNPDASMGGTTFTAPSSGMYSVSATGYFPFTTAVPGTFRLLIVDTASTDTIGSSLFAPHLGLFLTLSADASIYLTAGTSVHVSLEQTSGSARTFENGKFAAVKLRG